tara:strand:- start:467 stop:874 length:408 start_codon:yes stop_codon:yes gene_type:complete
MYNYYFCSKLDDEFYDHKLDISHLPKLIDKYDLKYINHIKEYWINNVQIISDKDNIQFKKIIDKNIHFDNNYIQQEYQISNCDKFNFNESDLEEEYNLYENIINDIKIKVKKYDNFITLIYESKNNIDNNFLYYI